MQGAEESSAQEAGPAVEGGAPGPYRPPRLVVYGRLTEITRFGGSETVDSGPDNLGDLQ